MEEAWAPRKVEEVSLLFFKMCYKLQACVGGVQRGWLPWRWGIGSCELSQVGLGIRPGSSSRAVQAHGCEVTCPGWVPIHRSVSVTVAGSKGYFLSEGYTLLWHCPNQLIFYFMERFGDKIQKKKMNLSWLTRHSALLLAIWWVWHLKFKCI